MNALLETRVCALLRDVLALPPSFPLGRQTRLLGALAALDSMAVVTLLAEFEDSFGFTVADDELSAEVFTSVGSLVDWIAARSGAASETPGEVPPPLATPAP